MSYLKQTTGMGTWKTRKISKLARKSRESGKKKGLVPPAWARYVCRSNRSYKSEFYSRWDTLCDGGKIKWSKA